MVRLDTEGPSQRLVRDVYSIKGNFIEPIPCDVSQNPLEISKHHLLEKVCPSTSLEELLIKKTQKIGFGCVGITQRLSVRLKVIVLKQLPIGAKDNLFFFFFCT